jgi:NADP-dependent 3-hydroxy acid dehydrogenase YdfG
MNENISGKVVVITGASSGLGAATAKLLAKHGATVVLGARRKDRIDALADELNGIGGKALAVETDVRHREQVKRLVDSAVNAFGRIDVMLNNAGLMPLAPLERLKTDEWDQMIRRKLEGRSQRHRRSASVHERAKKRPLHQCVIRLRTQAGARRYRVLCDEVCRSCPLGRSPPGSEALQHPHYGDLAGCRGDRTP